MTYSLRTGPNHPVVNPISMANVPDGTPPPESTFGGSIFGNDARFTKEQAAAMLAPFLSVPVTTVPVSGAAQSLAFPASGSAAYDLTLTANCTITLSGGTAGQQQTITLYLRQDAAAGHTPTLPPGVKWPGGNRAHAEHRSRRRGRVHLHDAGRAGHRDRGLLGWPTPSR